MENKQSPSKRKLISIQEEKFIREIDYESYQRNCSKPPKKELVLDLEIFRKNPSQAQPSQRVLVSIKPRAPSKPAIKTLYIAEKNRYCLGKDSDKSVSRSRLGIGDHSSLNTTLSTRFTEHSLNYGAEQKVTTTSAVESNQISTTTAVEKSTDVSLCSNFESKSKNESWKVNVYQNKKRSAEKCYMYTQPQFTMNLPRVEAKEKVKVDIGTLTITSSEATLPVCSTTIKQLHKRIAHLERKILRQEMVFRSLDPNIQLSSSDEECMESKMRAASGSGRPCCSYIEQYSHIPETSAFQRYAQHSSPLSRSKATTLEKEHNSEQYGRDFTTYDGITARGRRQCASVPCKRDDFPKMAAERVHKIRHKLNPVRDYRLMDTVHYLAQGEFAPRDDGIKLTPSREAVLSDIIWEDVCRTHWPTARLGRRNQQPERCGTRCELQRLIDGLLRERVAHVERRRRRHYRIVKLNHRHESCRPVGKTGDIIVASHKNKGSTEGRDVHISDHNAASAMLTERRWEDQQPRKSHRSHDRLMYSDSRQKRRFREEDCSPGPSYAVSRGPGSREPTCCYRSAHPTKLDPRMCPTSSQRRHARADLTSGSSIISRQLKNPRLVVKKDANRNKKAKDEPNLEQYILLPTLVIRTPSNVKRQKKFSELYHRILNVQMNNDNEGTLESEEVNPTSASPESNKKDVGLNIKISVGSTEKIDQP